jgi:hypothetical protein
MLRSITQSETVSAVYHEDRGMRSLAAPTVILVAWPDGHLVWSRDRLRGGPPYFERDGDPKTVTDMFSGFEEDGMFFGHTLSRCFSPPDHPYITILLRAEGKQLKMSSCHELAEAHGAVVTSGGIMGSDYPHTRVDGFAREPAWYLHFRLFWSETRRKLEELILPTGEASAGVLVQEAGELFWQEI